MDERELFERAATGDDSDQRWEYIASLHKRGSIRVLELAQEFCLSADPLKRMVGVDVLGQLGVPKRTFPEESLATVTSLLDGGQDPGVLNSIGVAIGHLAPTSTDWLPALLQHERHEDADVRQGVAFALLGRPEPACVDALIRLANDAADGVREWAVFGLRMVTEADDTKIRQALHAHILDPCPDVRAESILGLASRGDTSVIPALLAEFQEGRCDSTLLEAASYLKSAELHQALAAIDR